MKQCCRLERNCFYRQKANEKRQEKKSLKTQTLRCLFLAETVLENLFNHLPQIRLPLIISSAAVVLKEGGIAPFGTILRGKGANKRKEAIKRQNNTKGVKTLNHYH